MRKSNKEEVKSHEETPSEENQTTVAAETEAESMAQLLNTETGKTEYRPISELLTHNPNNEVSFSSKDTVTEVNGEAGFKADDSASASLATHVRGLLICNKYTQTELRKSDSFDTSTQKLIAKGLTQTEGKATDNSNFRELQSYVNEARKESKHSLSGTTRSNLRACLDAYDKEQDAQIKKAFAASKPDASYGDALTDTETESDEPTEQQVASLKTAIVTFNNQQAVKRHYARVNRATEHPYGDIELETVFDEDGKLKPEAKHQLKQSKDFEYFKHTSLQPNAVFNPNYSPYPAEADALIAQAQLKAIEDDGNGLSSAITSDLSSMAQGNGKGTWAREVQKDSYGRINSSINTGSRWRDNFSFLDLPIHGAGSSPWFMDLRGLRGQRYSTRVDEDGKMKIDVHTPTTKNFGFSTDYSSYAKSLFNAQHAGGLYGKNVTVTINDKDPAVVRKKISALAKEAQERGVPLSSITVKTPQLGVEPQSLKKVVTDASNNQHTYGYQFCGSSNLGKSWAEGIMSGSGSSMSSNISNTAIHNKLYSQKAHLEDNPARLARTKEALDDDDPDISPFSRWAHEGFGEDEYETSCDIPKPDPTDPFECATHKRVLEEEIAKQKKELKSDVDELKKIDKEYLEKKAKLDSYDKAYEMAKTYPLDSNSQLEKMDKTVKDALAIIKEDKYELAAQLDSEMETAREKGLEAEKECFKRIKKEAEAALKKNRDNNMAPATKRALQSYNRLQVVEQAYDDAHESKPAKQYTQLNSINFTEENGQLKTQGKDLADSLVNPGIVQRARNTIKARPNHQVTLEKAAQQAQQALSRTTERGRDILEPSTAPPVDGSSAAPHNPQP